MSDRETATERAQKFVYELRRKSLRHTSASMHAYDFECGCALCESLPQIGEHVEALAAENAALRNALEPFALPRATARQPQDGPPEDDVMRVEVRAGDWIRACVALGNVNIDYLRTLPPHVRPSDAFLATLASGDQPA